MNDNNCDCYHTLQMFKSKGKLISILISSIFIDFSTTQMPTNAFLSAKDMKVIKQIKKGFKFYKTLAIIFFSSRLGPLKSITSNIMNEYYVLHLNYTLTEYY